MKQFLLTLTVILSVNLLTGQNYGFGKISKEELEEAYHPKDSSASAAVLYRKESINLFFTSNEEFMQEREVHERIKIYNKDGFDWATKRLYLYRKNEQKENLSNLRGVSYNFVNGKIEKDKLKNDGKFEEDYNEFTKISSFTLPNVKEGTIIEYKYKIVSSRYGIDDVIFQYSIPINKLEINIATPEYYVYKKQYNHKASYLPKIVDSYKNVSIPFEHKINISTINEEHIPALIEEAFVGNIDNYRSKMAMELTAYLNNLKLVEKSFSFTWDDVSKTIYDSKNFGGQLGRFNIYKEDLETLLSGVEDDFEKAILVENLVKSKVKWNGNYGKYTQKGIRSAYKDGEGNVADINLMLVSMLRSQGVNANPVVLSTRSNGIPLFPTLSGFNYVICSVQKNDEYILIDATEPYSTNNVLPLRVLNWQGRLMEDTNKSRWINLQAKKHSTQSTMLNVKISDDYTVTGNVAKHLSNYRAYLYREKYANVKVEEHVKSLEKNKGAIEISELNIENFKNIAEPIKVNYKYELTDAIDEIGDKLYFTPLLFLRDKENPFKLEERQYPIDFVIPNSEKYLVNILIPEGFNIEYLPTSEAIQFKDSDVKFTYLAQQNGNYLQLKVQLDIVNTLILPEDYKGFKAFYTKIVEKQAEQIILTKN